MLVRKLTDPQARHLLRELTRLIDEGQTLVVSGEPGKSPKGPDDAVEADSVSICVAAPWSWNFHATAEEEARYGPKQVA
jgi:hypothetical protein